MDTKLRCVECGREPREDENADDEWRAGSDGVGELHDLCPECWEREFGENAARSLARQGSSSVVYDRRSIALNTSIRASLSSRLLRFTSCNPFSYAALA